MVCKGKELVSMTIRIAGNFGEVFNLANWQIYGKSPNLKRQYLNMQYFDDVMTSSHARSPWHQNRQRVKVISPGR